MDLVLKFQEDKGVTPAGDMENCKSLMDLVLKFQEDKGVTPAGDMQNCKSLNGSSTKVSRRQGRDQKSTSDHAPLPIEQ